MKKYKFAGRNLEGIHFALDYLIQANRRVAGQKIPSDEFIDAKDKKVVVMGGGDTGADCVGVAHRQGASCVAQIELLTVTSALVWLDEFQGIKGIRVVAEEITDGSHSTFVLASE